MINNLISSFPKAEFMPLVFFMSGLSIPVDTNVVSQIQKIYQLDIFSIINFGLSIAALIVTCFMGILSWLFFKESKKDSDSTQKALVKIEILAANIEADMMDIIRSIIGNMTNNVSDSTLVNDGGVLINKVEDISRRLDEVSVGIEKEQSGKKEISDLISEFKNIIKEQNELQNTLNAKSVELSVDKIDQNRLMKKIFDPERFARIEEKLRNKDEGK